MKKTYEFDEKIIAFVVDSEFDEYVTPDGPGFSLERLTLSEMEITEPGNKYFRERRYVVAYDVNKGDIGGSVPNVWEFSYEDFTEAYNYFKYEVTRNKSVWGKIHLCDRFELDYGYLYDDGTPYSASSTGGDYGPGNPWDAPGMSVSDFIRGVN